MPRETAAVTKFSAGVRLRAPRESVRRPLDPGAEVATQPGRMWSRGGDAAHDLAERDGFEVESIGADPWNAARNRGPAGCYRIDLR